MKNSIVRGFFKNILVRFFDEWELRSMVVLSLVLQFCLVLCGNSRRKYRGKWLPIIEITAWSIFLLADWIANVVLSTLLRGEVTHKDELVLWTSFILWHLGSPFNITAYSIEDNELWLRRAFGMLVQVGEALYIFIKFQSPIKPLNFVAIPIFIAGILRYTERVVVLRSASQKQLRDSMTSEKDTSEETKIVRTGRINSLLIREYLGGRSVVPRIRFLREAHLSSIIHKPLFTQLPFRVSKEFHDDMVFTKSRNAEEAFKLIGTQLHFFYNLFYTKIAMLVSHHKLSFGLRIFCFLSAASSLFAYAMIDKQRQPANDHKSDNYLNENVDILITYLLLAGAMALDAHSFFRDVLAMSWTSFWLPIPSNWLKHYNKSSLKFPVKLKSMGQHDLLDYYIKARTTNKLSRVIKFLDMHTGNYLQIFWYGRWKPINPDLKDFIYSRLKEKRQKFESEKFNFEFLPRLLDEFKGGKVFNRKSEEKGVLFAEDWEMDTTDFTRCVFLWHIATGLVYYDDLEKHQIGTVGKYGKIGKSLSDYMMYLVLARPLMLPLGFSEAANRDTYREAEIFLRNVMKEKRSDVRRKQFTSGLLAFNPEASSFYQRTSRENYSELFKGCIFGKKLQSLVTQHRWDHEEKWELISDLWMEMLTYAASYCSWKQHAAKLRRGGELRTHVSLLMAHIGLNTQIRIREKAEDVESYSLFLDGNPVHNF